MKDAGIFFRGGIALAALVCLAGPADAQAYGPSPQILTIGAVEFRSREPFIGFEYIGSDQYLYNLYPEDPDFVPWYLAPLALPDGALVEEICLFANDTAVGDSVIVQLVAVKLAPGGESPDKLFVEPLVSSFYDSPWERYCESASQRVRRKIDVDGDGVEDDAVWYVRAQLRHPPFGNLGLGGVQIRWRRQTSPPPPVATFGDVPTSHPFYEFVESLAASGITGGCGGGNFCPASPLTRGQMAVFLSKSLGLHWTD